MPDAHGVGDEGHDARVFSRVISDAHALDPRMTFPSLPCYPCPHAASCCAYGTSLTDAEAAAIAGAHGHGMVYFTRWGEWRTRVRGKRCALYRDGGCTIHDASYYPAQCRTFPWTDPETGLGYEYDVTICGDFQARPELVEIQRAIPRAVRQP